MSRLDGVNLKSCRRWLVSPRRIRTDGSVSPVIFLAAVLCLAGSWFFAVSIASIGGVGLKPGHANDLFPLWNASRAVRHHVNPYGPETTEQNQIAAYGATAKAVGDKNEQRFLYPLQATFPVLPLGLLDFRSADKIALLLMTVLVAVSVGWLRDKWNGTTIVYCLLAFASYPIIVALQMRQPTLLFLGFVVGSLALLRSGRLTSAAIVAAVACGKPQIAGPVLLPMLIWSIDRWRDCKRFVIAFATSLLGLLLISGVVSPGWVSEWLNSLSAYSGYVHPSIVVGFLGVKTGFLASGALFAAVAVSLWRDRHGDLGFQVAFSVAVLSLLIQGELYNMSMLLIPTVWIADNVSKIRDSGGTNQLALAFVRIALLEFWCATAVGGFLMHSSPMGQAIGWWFSVNAVFPVVVAILVLLALERFSGDERWKEKVDERKVAK